MLLDGNGELLNSALYSTRRWLDPPVNALGAWRKVRIQITDQSLLLFYNGEVALTHEADWNQEFGGMGFSAGTGDVSARHLIRKVRVSPLTESALVRSND